MKKYFTGVAFVSFETEKQQKEILELAEKSEKLFSNERISPFYGNIL